MFRVTVDDYTLLCSPDGLPTMHTEYVAHARLHEMWDTRESEGSTCFVGVARGNGWPFLAVTQRYSPDGAGFYPGALLVPETGVLFLGAGQRLLAYDLREPRRLWEDDADCGFWGWSRHGETVLMSAELELAAWSLRAGKLWSTYVEPPWDYSVDGETVHLRVMDRETSFPLIGGPVHA